MTAWTQDEITRIGGADELQIASVRPDGSLSGPRTIWVVPVGDELYVRSVNGPDADWFRGTRARHEGQVRAGGLSRDVTFAEGGHGSDDQIDAAYQSKYSRYPRNLTDSVLTPQARSTTLRLVPRAPGS